MFQRPRGTRDFLPDDMLKRRYLENKLREVFLSYGYREVQTPTFEHLELFTAKSGEGIIEEMYTFKDKSGRDLALRPELTAPVIRMYVEKLQMSPKPIKLFYFGNCYRYDRPQKGRYREFTQAGCELIGCDSPPALAELVSLAWECMEKSGLKNFNLRIGNLDILNKFLNTIGLTDSLKKKAIPLIDKREYDALRELLSSDLSQDDIDRLERFLQTKSIDEIEKQVDKGMKDDIERFRHILSWLDVFGIKKYEISMEIVRGLEYYRGMVFEIECPELGAERQICGGGEYELVELFGGKNIPTAGFAIGFDRVIIALEEEGFAFPEEKIDFYIIPASEDVVKEAIEISMKLRNKGESVDIDLTGRNLRKSMKYADSIGAKRVIIVGKKDLEENKVTIRDMESGEQERVEVDKL